MKHTELTQTETVVDGDTANADGPASVPTSEEAIDMRTAHGDPAPSSEDRALPLDQTFELLKNQRRRYVLQYLESEGEPVSLSELAEQIAAWENDKEVRLISSSERKRVYVGLYQCHLPKMDDMGAISFNKPRGIIERGDTADCLTPYLQPAAESDEGIDHRFYGGLAVVSVGLLTILTLSVERTAALFVAVAVVLLGTLALAHHLARQRA
jgi:hypothetical protein